MKKLTVFRSACLYGQPISRFLVDVEGDGFQQFAGRSLDIYGPVAGHFFGDGLVAPGAEGRTLDVEVDGADHLAIALPHVLNGTGLLLGHLDLGVEVDPTDFLAEFAGCTGRQVGFNGGAGGCTQEAHAIGGSLDRFFHAEGFGGQGVGGIFDEVLAFMGNGFNQGCFRGRKFTGLVAGAGCEEAQHQDYDEGEGGGEEGFESFHGGVFLLVNIVFLLSYNIKYASARARIGRFGTQNFEFGTKGELVADGVPIAIVEANGQLDARIHGTHV